MSAFGRALFLNTTSATPPVSERSTNTAPLTRACTSWATISTDPRLAPVSSKPSGSPTKSASASPTSSPFPVSLIDRPFRLALASLPVRQPDFPSFRRFPPTTPLCIGLDDKRWHRLRQPRTFIDGHKRYVSRRRLLSLTGQNIFREHFYSNFERSMKHTI